MKYTVAGIAMVLSMCANVAGAQQDAVPRPPPGPAEFRPARAVPPVAPAVNEMVDVALREEAQRIIETLATDRNFNIRANAVETAQKNLPPAVSRPIAIRGFSDEAPVVRFAAAVAAGDLKLQDTKPVLLKLAYDTDPSVRLAARYALHRLGDSALTQEMLYGLRDDRPGVRGNTVMLLGMLGEKSAIAPIRRIITDRSPTVRLQLHEALWRLGERQSVEELVIFSMSKFPDEQVVSLIALAQPRDQRVTEQLSGWLVDDFPEVTLAAARGLGMLGSDEGYGVAMRFIKSKEPRQRAMAALALGEIGRIDAQSRLKPLLADPSADVRLAAASAVLKLRPPRK